LAKQPAKRLKKLASRFEALKLELTYRTKRFEW